MTRKNEQKTYTDKRGKFGAGNPGKPMDARHTVTRAVEELRLCNSGTTNGRYLGWIQNNQAEST